jgi:hypothetical protein
MSEQIELSMAFSKQYLIRKWVLMIQVIILISHIVTFSFINKMASQAKTLLFVNFVLSFVIMALLYLSYRKQLALIVYGIILTEI